MSQCLSIFQHADRGPAVTVVAVAAILVASIQVHCRDQPLALQYRGTDRVSCSATFQKGDELGYFQRRSTLLLFVRGPLPFADGRRSGQRIQMGEALLVRT